MRKTISSVKPSFRPLVEVLEDRCVPAGGYPYGLEVVGSDVTDRHANFSVPVTQGQMGSSWMSMVKKTTLDVHSETISLADDNGNTGTITNSWQDAWRATVLTISGVTGNGSRDSNRTSYVRTHIDNRVEDYVVGNMKIHNVQHHVVMMQGVTSQVNTYATDGSQTTQYWTLETSMTTGSHNYLTDVNGDQNTDVFDGSSTSWRQATSTNWYDQSGWRFVSNETQQGSFTTTSVVGLLTDQGGNSNTVKMTNDFANSRDGQSNYVAATGVSTYVNHEFSTSKVMQVTHWQWQDTDLNRGQADTIQKMDWSGFYTWSSINRQTGVNDYSSTSQISVSSTFDIQTVNSDLLGNIINGTATAQFIGTLATLDSGSYPINGGPVINLVRSYKPTIIVDQSAVSFDKPATTRALTGMITALGTPKTNLDQNPFYTFYTIGSDGLG